MGMVVPSWVEYRSLAEAVRARALATPARELYTFLENGEEEGALHLTWGELDRRARSLARALRDLRAAGADGPALLLCPPGLDFPVAFFGCLLAGVPAVPVYPPGSRRHLPRLRAVARDARPAVALTTSAVLDRTAGWLDRDAELPRVRWIAVDRVEPGPDDGWEPPAPDGGDLAFLQYTSGSTADPRGVRVGHANLLHNLALIRDACGHDEGSVFVSWLPLFHDLGLIGNLLQAAFVGARAVLMAPTAFLQRPVRWLEAVSRYGATTSGGPDFAYELCVRRIAPAERERLDLSRWRVAFNGAEPVRAATLARFAEAFAPCGFRAGAAYPCYGLAEATLMVSGGRPGEGPVVRELDAAALERGEVRAAAGGPRRALVGCGRPLGGQTVAIVDPATGTRLGPGGVGEIWLAGPSVAGGYWGRPEETAAAFGAMTADGEGPFLRTGDLGFLDGGELFVAGRLKDLIVLRGRNLYPQDVELAAERSHPELAPGSAAAFAVEAEGEERLTVVVELPRRWAGDPEALAAAVRRAVAEELEAHVREVVLVPAGALPRTSSGKVQRRRCRSLLLAGGLPVMARSATTEGTEAAEAGEVEAAAFDRGALLALPAAERRAALDRLVAGRVARALRATAAVLAPGTPLAGLGLDSLAAIELRGDLADLLGAPPPLEELLAEGATLGGLTAWAERALDAPPTAGEAEAAGEAAEPAGKAETITELPLAYVQEALWVIQRLAPEGTAYHVPFAARLPAGTDAGALARALRALLDRHAALATTFHDRGGVPVQRLGRGAPPTIEVVDAEGWSDERLAREIEGAAHRPFDLERGPLARACLFRRPEGDHLLLVFHHLVIDGWSLWRLLGELGALYVAESAPGALEPPALPAPGPGYGEFVRWQRRRLAGEDGERLWRLWRPRLAGVPPLELPADLPRAPAAVRPGGSLELRLDAGLGRALRALAASRGVTLFILVLAAFQALLYRWTGQEEFLVGVAAWGRSRPELEPVVGCCFNVVPVPAAPSARLPFGEHLRRVQREARASIALQDLPSHLMAERLPAGEAGLFQVTFLWQKPQWLPEAPVAFDPAGRTLAARGLVLEPVAVGRRAARQELELEVIEAGETLLAAFHYDAGLFRAATVRRLADHLESLLRAVAAGPDLPLGDLPLLSAAESHLLTVELSGAGDPEAPVPSVLAQLGERLRSASDHLAAAHPRRRLTYGQLDRRSAELAALIGRLEP